MSTPDYSSVPRGRRLYPTKYKQDKNRKTGILKWCDGNLETASGNIVDSIEISGQKITLDCSKLYPDDLMALLRDWMIELVGSTPKDQGNAFALSAIKHIENALLDMDQRTVQRHNYSFSPLEKVIPVPKRNE